MGAPVPMSSAPLAPTIPPAARRLEILGNVIGILAGFGTLVAFFQGLSSESEGMLEWWLAAAGVGLWGFWVYALSAAVAETLDRLAKATCADTLHAPPPSS